MQRELIMKYLGAVACLLILTACTGGTPRRDTRQLGELKPDPIRRCFQQAYTWLGYYDGPLDGRMNAATEDAQHRYLQAKGIPATDPRVSQMMLTAIEADLRRVGREGDWQDCLTTSALLEPGPAGPVEPSPGSLAYLDFRNGFRDLKFGDPPAADMRLVEDHGETTYYTRPGDDLRIGNSQLNRIAYGFYRGRFYTALLSTEGLTNSRALLEVLRQAYGRGARPNRFMDRYYWEGSRVVLSYDENPLNHDATVVLSSVPLQSQKTAEDKAKARKGVSGL
jgi:hypothetical protein